MKLAAAFGNLKFLNSLPEDELRIFQEAAALSTEVEMAAWDEQVEEAKNIAQNDMGVEFIEVDVQVFKDAVSEVQAEMLESNPRIQDLYEHIQSVNAAFE